MRYFHSFVQQQPVSDLFPYTTLFRSQQLFERLPHRAVQLVRRGEAFLVDRDDHLATILGMGRPPRSEEHTSELQSLRHFVCRLLREKRKTVSCVATRRSRPALLLVSV